ncbi:MAG: HU family DNA-binding protein [Thermodesulfobacteriota bacterium]
MTKGDLITVMASKADISKAAAERALNAFTEGVTDSLKKGVKVSLVGFGTFDVANRAARQGRNPRTGATINIPAARTPKFRSGKALKEAVR